MIQRTFAIIKPEAVADKNIGKIIDLIEKNGFEVLGMKKILIPKNTAEHFYDIHKERPFFNDMIKFITSGPVVVMALEKENAVQSWRDLIGATNPENAAKGTIRNLYGKSIDNNAVHGSDASETANREISIFFPELS